MNIKPGKVRITLTLEEANRLLHFLEDGQSGRTTDYSVKSELIDPLQNQLSATLKGQKIYGR